MSHFKKTSDDRLERINSASVTRLNRPTHSLRRREKSPKFSFLSSLKNTIFSRPYLIGAAAVIIFVSPSIYAQIKNIYDAKEDNISGITSLMSAVASNDVNGVKFFAKAGPASINQKNFGGATALHIAAREGNLEIAKILIENGANVNAADNEGWTPLMRSSLAANRDIVELLLSKNAQAELLNSSKESAIFHAASSDCNDCLGLLFERFNFAQFMDIESLKTQLTDSFVVARNHENQAAQDMIAAYLDRVSQVAPNNVSQGVGSMENGKAGKKFVFKSDGKKTIVTEELPQAAPVSISKNNKSSFVQKDLQGNGTPAIQNSSSVKFKFVVGEQGKSRKKAVRIVEEKKHDVVDSVTVVKPQKNESEAVLSNEKTPVEEVVVETAAPVNGVIYKFKSGPAGKKIKRKVEKKVVAPSLPSPTENTAIKAAEPTQIAPTTATPPVAPSPSQPQQQPSSPAAQTPSAPVATPTPAAPAPASPAAK
jgi:hypothetical protein